jgi:DoxX-like family
MNMQTIQILLLLLDNMIKLAPWRIVTETMDRIGYGASESLARSLGVLAVSSAGLFAFPPIPFIGPVLRTCYFGGAMASSIHLGSPLSSHLLFGFFLGVTVWGGLWWCDRSLRALLSRQS